VVVDLGIDGLDRLVELDLSLLDKLHNGYGRDDLCTAVDGEHVVRRHLFILFIETAYASSCFCKIVSLTVHRSEYYAWNTIR